MRIRTDGKFEHRKDVIDRVADFYGSNRTDAVLAAAEDAPQLVESIATVLQRDDLTDQQRREIAETLSTSAATFEVSVDVDVEVDP
jgi:uncharacterized protein (DUF1778 family)